MGAISTAPLKRALGDKLRMDDLAPNATKIAGALVLLGVLGAALFAVFDFDHIGPRFWSAYFVGVMFLLSLCLGGLFFVLVQHLTRAGWSVTVRRVAELVAGNIVLVAVLFLPLIYPIAKGYLQPKAKMASTTAHAETAHSGHAAGGHHGDPWVVGPTLEGAKHPELDPAKAKWLSFGPLMARLAIYFAIWIVLALFYKGNSLKQDETKDPALTNKMQAFAPFGVLLYGFSVSLAAFDLLMALDPYWYSTMFGVYFFAGCFMSFFATLNLTMFLLRSKGVGAEAISAEHYQDTGKFMFAFTVFWAYVAFSQFMLIWYGNLPEEGGWFWIRWEGAWKWVSIALMVGHFIIPFFLVMSRHVKRNPAILAGLSVYMLCMHWLDLFFIVAPQKAPLGVVPIPLMDLSILVALIGVFAVGLIRGMTGVNVIPTGDPRLIEAVHFHNQ